MRKKKNDNSSSTSKHLAVKFGIRYKILVVIIPLIIVIFVFLGVTTYFSSSNGITKIAKEFLGYRLEEVFRFAQAQVLRRDSSQSEGYLGEDCRINILEYSRKFPEETVVLIPYSGNFTVDRTLFWASRTNINMEEIKKLFTLLKKHEEQAAQNPDLESSWLEYTAPDRTKRVGVFLPNIDLQAWIVMVVPYEYFYSPVYEIMKYLGVIFAVGLFISTLIVWSFVDFLTKPLKDSVSTIQAITKNMDLTRRIKISYLDEIGYLGRSFNDMIEELEKAYNQIKNYAYQAVLAKTKEEQIRFIFQKYVPSDVIDYVLNRSSEALLVGDKQIVSVLFSDIRDFTTIAEMLHPEDLVLSLNAYFTEMVNEIIQQEGIIDKFIGDAIMAVFGAPKSTPYDVDHAVAAALGMLNGIERFNAQQKSQDKITFEIGIGINTGEAVVGNIGSEQKIEFTVIGDTVNLASRLEGLTKQYKCPILISESTKNALSDKDRYFFVNVDTVRVKGKAFPVKIFEPKLKESLTAPQIMFYRRYHEALQLYFQGLFSQALPKFSALKQENPDFYLAFLYADRCTDFIEEPPQNWDGAATWGIK